LAKELPRRGSWGIEKFLPGQLLNCQSLGGEAASRGICCVTALSATTALVQSMAAAKAGARSTYALQDIAV
jgi:hypothetical protein